jgi:nitrate reductase NapE component
LQGRRRGVIFRAVERERGRSAKLFVAASFVVFCVLAVALLGVAA